LNLVAFNSNTEGALQKRSAVQLSKNMCTTVQLGAVKYH